jgi:hydrogenase-4 component E
MHLTGYELLEVSVAIAGIMMLGARGVRLSLGLFSLQTVLMCATTVWAGHMRGDVTLYSEAGMVFVAKAVIAPIFLSWVMSRIGVVSESRTFIAPPITMHFGILLLGISYLLAERLPNLSSTDDAGMGATAALGLLFMGMTLMVSRRLAINQVIGFLVIENGIYMYQLTQTRDMPFIVEMGILLDVLVGVMVAGMLLFRIQKNFEHIDVTQLTRLKD